MFEKDGVYSLTEPEENRKSSVRSLHTGPASP